MLHRIIGAFDPEEVIFMLYMGHITQLYKLGYRTCNSQQYHMMRMGIGRRIFKKCEERFIKIGLLHKEVLPKSIVRYSLNFTSYYKLVNILNLTQCTEMNRRFCDELLNDPNAMLIDDISENTMRQWTEQDRIKNGAFYDDDM